MYTLVMSLKTLPDLNVSAIVLNEGKLAVKLRDAGLEAAVIEESKNNFFQILSQIKKVLRNKKIDILHSHRYKENILAALLKKRGVVQHLVQTVHGINEPLKGIRLLKARFYSFLNLYYTRKYFDKVITVSFDIQNKLSRKIDPNKLVAVHNAIDPADITIKKTANRIREELGIEENQPIIGTAGRMVPVKGYNIFLDMAKIILEKTPEVRFLLVGDGPLKQELEGMTQNLGIDKEVIFPGFRDDIIDIINCLDIFVISSYHEGIPIALLEAMALKKAIVATAVGGINEIIENDVSGILVNPGDSPALAEACIKVLDDINIKKKLENEAPKRINSEFSVEIQKSYFLKIYRELIQYSMKKFFDPS